MFEFAAPLVDRVLAFFGARGVSVSIVLVLTALLLYSRKAMLVGAIVADWTSKMMFAVAVLLVLLLLGIVNGVDVGRGIELVSVVLDWALRLLPVVLEAVNGVGENQAGAIVTRAFQ